MVPMLVLEPVGTAGSMSSKWMARARSWAQIVVTVVAAVAEVARMVAASIDP